MEEENGQGQGQEKGKENLVLPGVAFPYEVRRKFAWLLAARAFSHACAHGVSFRFDPDAGTVTMESCGLKMPITEPIFACDMAFDEPFGGPMFARSEVATVSPFDILSIGMIDWGGTESHWAALSQVGHVYICEPFLQRHALIKKVFEHNDGAWDAKVTLIHGALRAEGEGFITLSYCAEWPKMSGVENIGFAEQALDEWGVRGRFEDVECPAVSASSLFEMTRGQGQDDRPLMLFFNPQHDEKRIMDSLLAADDGRVFFIAGSSLFEPGLKAVLEEHGFAALGDTPGVRGIWPPTPFYAVKRKS
ncbi:MAG: hypothetical protein LBR38_09010 [Synergistaceae bacterium]|nr:hypothetical protein [Synergistaceae bacterium]